tara:strand:+ start:1220 stop:2533 length:1314 start_codon:yes stop_codon:yes gene_type:complete
MADATNIPAIEKSTRETLVRHQTKRLNELLKFVKDNNVFYSNKFSQVKIDSTELNLFQRLATLPLTTKDELILDQESTPPWGTALSEPLEQFTRYSQTSSTTGRPLKWLDTSEGWQWMLDCWKAVYRAARVKSEDRIFFPFSFGPFLGFWTAFEAGIQIGAHCIPAGGMTSQTRLTLIKNIRPTVICCTPTYALRLLEVAREDRDIKHFDVTKSVQSLIVAGEPGGSITSTRTRIEEGWNARVIDHHGMTEVGPISFECWENPGNLHLNECEFICEILDPKTLKPVSTGTQGELVITNLGRKASPLIRYRSGDLVIASADNCPCGRTLTLLKGGIRSRIDDMVYVNGVNIYPAAVESVLRAVDEIVEYRATVNTRGTLRVLSVEIELDETTENTESVMQRTKVDFQNSLGLKVPVTIVPAGALPRYEMKARRFVVVP